MNTFKKMLVAYNNGIKNPYMVWRASQASGLPFPVLCAVLEKETGGGANIFGHDPTIFVGAGTVTKAKYLEYKAERDRFAPKSHQMQGVGPHHVLLWRR